MLNLEELVFKKGFLCYRVRKNRDIYTLSRILKSIGVRKFEITIKGNRKCIEIPSKILENNYNVLLVRLYIISHILGAPFTLVMGVDPGQRNTGVAILVNNILAYSSIYHNYLSLGSLLSAIIRYISINRIIVKIGFTHSNAPITREIMRNLKQVLEKVRKIDYSIILVNEEDARKLMIETFLKKKKTNPHIISALKIALWQSWKDYQR